MKFFCSFFSYLYKERNKESSARVSNVQQYTEKEITQDAKQNSVFTHSYK